MRKREAVRKGQPVMSTTPALSSQQKMRRTWVATKVHNGASPAQMCCLMTQTTTGCLATPPSPPDGSSRRCGCRTEASASLISLLAGRDSAGGTPLPSSFCARVSISSIQPGSVKPAVFQVITLISSSSLFSGLTLISHCQVCQLPALGSAKEAALPSASTHPSTQQRIPTELGEGRR